MRRYGGRCVLAETESRIRRAQAYMTLLRWVRAMQLKVPIQYMDTYNNIAVTHRFGSDQTNNIADRPAIQNRK